MNVIPHKLENPGAEFGERLDCSVRALHFALGIPYAEARRLLAAAGRKPGHKFSYCRFRASVAGWGLEERPELSFRTLGMAMPDFSKGRFLCEVSGHWFTVIDGVVHDSWEQVPGRRLKMVYTPKQAAP